MQMRRNVASNGMLHNCNLIIQYVGLKVLLVVDLIFFIEMSSLTTARIYDVIRLYIFINIACDVMEIYLNIFLQSPKN